MKCPQCQQDNPAGMNFCGECGARLAVMCSSCGGSNPPANKFCGQCGAPLSQSPTSPKSPSPQAYTPKHLADKILTSKAALEGERKQVTVLFADMKGSMELLADRDPEEARKLLDPVIEHMMEAVHRYEGTVSNLMGDGIMSLFGAPVAHEDHAVRACYAALTMQESVKRYAEGVRRAEGVPIQIRVGLNSGEVVVGTIGNDLKMDYTAVGQTTHLAARMEQMATPGSIMVSEYTHKLMEGFFRFKALGQLQVKGLAERVDSYELQGVGPLRTRLDVSARRGLISFVGRQTEMNQMRRALDLAKDGHGQITAVVGEPGVGKSRLCYEFKTVDGADWMVLEAFSVSYGKAYPYLPVTELLKNYFQISPEDDERARCEKVASKVLMLDRGLEDTLPYVHFMLGISEPDSALHQMDPQIRRQRTLDAIKRLVVRESLNQPLLVIFEDLHWVDDETQAFLNLLSESVPSARILLLVNYRPQYQHGWGSKTYYTQVRLDPLRQVDAQALLRALLGEAPELTPLKNVLIEKTEGNPFFIEELVQTLAEERVLIGEAGAYRLGKPNSQLQIPSTVQVALMARIDRLAPAEKSLVQAMAVMGRKFSSSLLTRLMEEPEAKLHGLVSRLMEGEFIYEQPAFPEVEYVFKHALTQEVAYNSVLTERRNALHERTAQAIERFYRDRLEDHYGDLAHHYSRSGNTEKAVEYLKLAGQQAVQQSATEAAVSYLTSAVELLAALPDTSERAQQELNLQLTLGTLMIAAKGHAAAEVLQTFGRARELCDQVGETRQLFQVLRGLFNVYLTRMELQTAREVGEKLLALAETTGDSGMRLEAHYTLGNTLNYLAEFGTAQSHFARAIALYDPQQHGDHAFRYGQDPGVVSRIYSAVTLWCLGYPDQAVQRRHEALKLAREVGHLFSLAYGQFFGLWVYQLRREWRHVEGQAQACVDLTTDQGFTVFLAGGKIFLGWALAARPPESDTGHARVEEGIGQMEQGLTAWCATGARVLRPYGLALLAEAHSQIGQHETGLTLLTEALAVTNQTEERRWEAELHRLRGELLLAQGTDDTTEAEACFRQALDLAREQEAKSWELRAATSLARLWQSQDKRQGAYALLAPVYGWFTEGFDTNDLKEAKALLEELS